MVQIIDYETKNISKNETKETILREQLYKKLILDKLEFNKGMLVENLVAQMFKANGHNLYFFSTSHKEAENLWKLTFYCRKNL